MSSGYFAGLVAILLVELEHAFNLHALGSMDAGVICNALPCPSSMCPRSVSHMHRSRRNDMRTVHDIGWNTALTESDGEDDARTSQAVLLLEELHPLPGKSEMLWDDPILVLWRGRKIVRPIHPLSPLAVLLRAHLPSFEPLLPVAFLCLLGKAFRLRAFLGTLDRSLALFGVLCFDVVLRTLDRSLALFGVLCFDVVLSASDHVSLRVSSESFFSCRRWERKRPKKVWNA